MSILQHEVYRCLPDGQPSIIEVLADLCKLAVSLQIIGKDRFLNPVIVIKVAGSASSAGISCGAVVGSETAVSSKAGISSMTAVSSSGDVACDDSGSVVHAAGQYQQYPNRR
ncbi:hypothetical protein ACFLX7_04000 [Chloroflexota bacterium]